MMKSNSFNDVNFKGLDSKNNKSSLDYTFYEFYRNEDTVNKSMHYWYCVKLNDKYYSCYDGVDLIELNLEKITISKEIDKSEIEEMMKEVQSHKTVLIKRRHLGTAFILLYTTASCLVENLCDKLYKDTNKKYDLSYLKLVF